MNIGILGSGDVARTLATGFLKHGHHVTIGSRTPGKLADWAANNPKGHTGTFADAAAFGELLVLAVKGSAAAQALHAAGRNHLSGKTVIDACNPIHEGHLVNGVLQSSTGPNESLMETLQQQFPLAHFVKAFNSVGAPHMVDPHFKDGKPTMFICGNHQASKQTVSTILQDFGWDVADMGAVESARAIEPLAVLWCIPGFLYDQWGHAFKLLRK